MLPVAYRPSIGLVVLVDDPGVLVGDEAAAGADVAGQRPRRRSTAARRSGRGTGAPCGSGRRAPGCRPTRPARSRGRRPRAACSLNRSIVSARPAGVDAAHAGQVVERPRLLEPAALEQLAREPAGAGPQVGVALAVAVVEDQPARHGPARLVAGVHRLADLHVRVRLVARSAGRRRRRRWCGGAGGPGRASTARTGPVRGDGSHHASSIRSVLAPRRMAVWSASPVSPGLAIDHLARFGWSPPYSLAHLGVVGEAAGGEQHALAGPDRARARRRGSARTPTTRPSSTIRSSSGASVQIGMPRPRAISSIWPISEAPLVSSAWPPGLGGVGAERRRGRRWRTRRRCGCSATATGPRSSSPRGRGSAPARAAAWSSQSPSTWPSQGTGSIARPMSWPPLAFE